MEHFDLYDIAERYMELINPFDPEKIKTVGKFLGLEKGKKVIEFGCGFGEVMVIWAGTFEISAVGIEIRKHACERANKKIEENLPEERSEGKSEKNRNIILGVILIIAGLIFMGSTFFPWITWIAWGTFWPVIIIVVGLVIVIRAI